MVDVGRGVGGVDDGGVGVDFRCGGFGGGDDAMKKVGGWREGRSADQGRSEGARQTKLTKLVCSRCYQTVLILYCSKQLQQ